MNKELSEKQIADHAKLLLKIADLAEAWWRGHRPVKWKKKQHMANPHVNLCSPSSVEKKLVDAIVQWRHIQDGTQPVEAGK